MRRWAWVALFGTILGLGGAVVALTPAGLRLEQTVGLTALYRLRGPVAPPPQVAIVSIDEASAVHLGLPLMPRDWPRSVHGRLIDRLVAKGAVVIAFDLAFERAQPLAEDLAFARAIADSRRVILFEAIERRNLAPHGVEPATAVWLELLRRPLPVFANAAAGLAPFPLPKVPGPVQQFLAFLPQSGERPTLPVVTLQAYAARLDPVWDAAFATLAERFVGNTSPRTVAPAALGDDATMAMSFRHAFAAGGNLARRLHADVTMAPLPPTRGPGGPAPSELRAAMLALYQGPSHLHLNFYGPPGTIRHIPYHALLADPQGVDPAGSLSGVAVFVGYSELAKPSKLDGFETAFHRGDGIDSSGVEIAATAFANLLTNTTLKPLSRLATALLLAGFGFALGAAAACLPLLRSLALTMPVAAGYTAVALLLFSRQQLWLPLAVPLLLQLPVALLAGALAQYLAAIRRQRRLQRARDAADAASRAKSEFLAVMSHELRTPMHGVVGFMELLGATPLDPAQQGLVAEARASSQALLEIVNDVLDFAKIEAGALQVNEAAFDPLALAASVVEALRPLAAAKPLRLRLQPALPLPPTIISDPLRLRQILVNLVGNAIKFTETGTVTLHLRMDGGADGRTTLVFDVVDTGIGIEPASLAAIFEPFTQGSAPAARTHGGTGLGLAISRRLAGLLGGTITATSQVGEGSVFTVHLPVVLAHPALAQPSLPPEPSLSDSQPPASAIAPPDRPGAERPGRGEVLVAEDHPTSQRLIEAQLASLGFTVRIASDGEAAWSSLLERPVAAIITDYHMPRLDGAGLARRIRCDRRLADTWIIGLTADVLDGSMRTCLDAGMDLVLVKPTSLAAIDRALAAARRSAGGSGIDRFPDPAAEREAESDEGPVFDPAQLREAFGSLDQQALALLGGFVEDTGARLSALRSHASDRDAVPLAQAAHRVAGACLTMGAAQLGQLCRQLERRAIARQWDGVDRLVVAIGAGFCELSAAVARLLDDQRSTN